MPQRSVIAIGEAIHKVVEQALKGVPMQKKPTRSAAQEEAKRLRIEQATRERADFAVKTPRRKSLDNMQSDSVDNDNVQGGKFEEELPPIDQALVEFQAPMIDAQLYRMGSSLTGISIMDEIHNDRLAGKLRPFVEGEPIGLIQHHKREPAPALVTQNEIMDGRRAQLRRRQKKNDRTLARIRRKYR